MDDRDRAALEKRINGALRMTISAHGSIGLEQIGSATKRILSVIEPPEKPGRKYLAELRLPGKQVILRQGDYVEVGPSRPNKRDGWKGSIVSLFSDRGGDVVEVHHPTDRIHRCVPVARIKGRRTAPEERVTPAPEQETT